MVKANARRVRAVIFAAAVIGLATSERAAAKVEEDTIALGATLSFSGTYAGEGNDTYNGYELAVDRINAAGGVKVGGKSYDLKIIY